MSRDHAPAAHVIERAVTIWKRALAAPIYRNTRPEEAEHLRNELMNTVFLGGAPKNNTPEVLRDFGDRLRELLTDGRMYTPTWGEDRTPYRVWEHRLRVDYHPDEVLQIAANQAGLKMPFPLKTNMEMRENSVSFSMGYGAPYVWHYPLSGGRWFMTTLRGYPEDEAALIAYVEAHGDLPFARIDTEE